MRVSTAQIFNAGSGGIQRNQSGWYKLQNQLSTGRRILAPEDDPVGASQALLVGQAKDVNAQYLENQGIARTQLNLVETTLGSVTGELQNIFERAVQAGNSTLSSANRGMIAEELKGRLENIVSLANSQDGNGQYIFAGYQAQSQPFSVAGNAAPYYLHNGSATPVSNPYQSYSGDDGQLKLQVSPSQEMATNVTGSEVFMNVRDGSGNVNGRSVFDSIKNLVDILDPNSSVPFSDSAYQTALNDIKASLDNVSRVRSAVGSRLATLESLDGASQDFALQYDIRLSELQDLDYAKAISDFSQQQMQLEAAQKSFSQINQLSLFNYL